MLTIADAVAPLGSAPLSEDAVGRHIRPLFSRALGRREIDLAGESMGCPLDQTAVDVREALDSWYDRGDGAWEPWLAEMEAYRGRIARLISCPRPDAIIPKACAGQGLRAVINAHGTPGTPSTGKRMHILATRGQADSIDFILRTCQARGRCQVSWIDPDPRGLFIADDIIKGITITVDLVVVPRVVPATGQVVGDLRRIAAAAHAVGGRMLIDASLAAGAIPFNLGDLGADFAIGESSRWTRTGPGAGWLAVHPRHLIDEPRPADRPRTLVTLDTGSMARHNSRQLERDDRAILAAGGDAWLEGLPAILPLYQARAGLELALAIGVDRLRAYHLEQQAHLRQRLTSAGVPISEPGSGNQAGHSIFVLVPVASAAAAVAAIKARGVNVDAQPMPRSADGSAGSGAGTPAACLRLCPDLLTTRDEMDRAAGIIAEVARV